jgi:hypothetical protein
MTRRIAGYTRVISASASAVGARSALRPPRWRFSTPPECFKMLNHLQTAESMLRRVGIPAVLVDADAMLGAVGRDWMNQSADAVYRRCDNADAVTSPTLDFDIRALLPDRCPPGRFSGRSFSTRKHRGKRTSSPATKSAIGCFGRGVLPFTCPAVPKPNMPPTLIRARRES